MDNQARKSTGPFKTSRDYAFNALGLYASGSSVDLNAGMRMHEFNFMAKERSVIPVGLPGVVVWAGIVLKGELAFQLPDLGLVSLKEGDWFMAQVNDCQIISEPDIHSAVMAFSFCACQMKTFGKWATEPLQQKLAGFNPDTPLLPIFLHGGASDELRGLSEALHIADCMARDTSTSVDERAKNWMTTLFSQQGMLQAPAYKFGIETSKIIGMRGGDEDEKCSCL